MGTGDAFITMKEKQETTDAHLFVQTITQQAEEIGRLKEQHIRLIGHTHFTVGDVHLGVMRELSQFVRREIEAQRS